MGDNLGGNPSGSSTTSSGMSSHNTPQLSMPNNLFQQASLSSLTQQQQLLLRQRQAQLLHQQQQQLLLKNLSSTQAIPSADHPSDTSSLPTHLDPNSMLTMNANSLGTAGVGFTANDLSSLSHQQAQVLLQQQQRLASAAASSSFRNRNPQQSLGNPALSIGAAVQNNGQMPLPSAPMVANSQGLQGQRPPLNPMIPQAPDVKTVVVVPEFTHSTIETILQMNQHLLKLLHQFQLNGWTGDPEMKIYQQRLQTNLTFLAALADAVMKPSENGMKTIAAKVPDLTPVQIPARLAGQNATIASSNPADSPQPANDHSNGASNQSDSDKNGNQSLNEQVALEPPMTVEDPHQPNEKPTPESYIPVPPINLSNIGSKQADSGQPASAIDPSPSSRHLYPELSNDETLRRKSVDAVAFQQDQKSIEAFFADTGFGATNQNSLHEQSQSPGESESSANPVNQLDEQGVSKNEDNLQQPQAEETQGDQDAIQAAFFADFPDDDDGEVDSHNDETSPEEAFFADISEPRGVKRNSEHVDQD